MKRIDHPYNSSVLAADTSYTAGTAGYFTVGNKSLGTPATPLTQDWANVVQEELCNVVTGAGLVLDQTSANKSQLLSAVNGLITTAFAVNTTYATKVGFQQNAYSVAIAGGTADAITASYTPAITALTNGMTLVVKAGFANVTTTPTFTPNSGTITAATIVKGNGLPLVAGDISTHWIELQYDTTLAKWILLNPTTGIAVTTVSNTWTAQQRGSIGTLTYGATVTPDFSTTNDFIITLTGNATLANPTNITVGAKGVFVINQDSTGARTFAYGTYFKFPSGVAPTLTTTPLAVDRIQYHVVDSTHIHCTFIGDMR